MISSFEKWCFPPLLRGCGDVGLRGSFAMMQLALHPYGIYQASEPYFECDLH